MVSVLESAAQKNANKQRWNGTTSKESCGLRLAGCEGRDSLDMPETQSVHQRSTLLSTTATCDLRNCTRKRPELTDVIFLCDHAQPNVVKLAQENFLGLYWEDLLTRNGANRLPSILCNAELLEWQNVFS